MCAQCALIVYYRLMINYKFEIVNSQNKKRTIFKYLLKKQDCYFSKRAHTIRCAFFFTPFRASVVRREIPFVEDDVRSNWLPLCNPKIKAPSCSARFPHRGMSRTQVPMLQGINRIGRLGTLLSSTKLSARFVDTQSAPSQVSFTHYATSIFGAYAIGSQKFSHQVHLGALQAPRHASRVLSSNK